MAVMDIHNLFYALIVLMCAILVLVLLLLFTHCLKNKKKSTIHHASRDVEATPSDPDQMSRPQVQHEHYIDQQRLSHLTTITPSIELLPEIRTSSERAENWLERRDSRLTEGEAMKFKDPKTYKVLGVKNEGALKWDWRGERMRGGMGGDDVKEEEEEKKTDSTMKEK
jgi:hypothetical protein